MIREFHTYDPGEVSFSFRGIRISGYAEGTFIEVERDEDGWTKIVGSLGDVTRVKNLNRCGSITLTLMQTSVINDYLQAIADEDEQFNTGFGPAQMMDHSGGAEAHSVISWIRKMPKIERAKEAGTVQWVIDCAELECKAFGNVIALPF